MAADARMNSNGQRAGGRDGAGPDAARHDASGPDATGPDAIGQAKAGFSEAKPRGHAAPRMPDPRKLAQDWITLWQSELSAMAADPEIRESWQTVMTLWAGTMSAVLQGLPRAGRPNAAKTSAGEPSAGGPSAGGHDGTGGQTRPADAPRSTAAAAAPDARDAEVERLARHVAVLERRLAELERGGDPAVPAKRRPKREPGRKQQR